MGVFGIAPARPLPFWEVYLLGGGRIVAPLFLMAVGAGLISAPWIWGVVALALVAVTVEALVVITRVRRFELSAVQWDPEGKEGGEDYRYVKMGTLKRALAYSAGVRRDKAASILMWCLVLPSLVFAAWAWSEPVLSWVNPAQYESMFVIVVGYFVLMWADCAGENDIRKRMAIRGVLALAVIVAMLSGLWIRHPYLRPGYPDAARVKVAQLLKSGDLHNHHYHVAALTRYAQELEEKGEIRKAGDLFKVASMVDLTNPDLQENFAKFLTRHAPAGEDTEFYKRAAEIRSGAALKASRDPYTVDPHGPLPLLVHDSPPGHAIVLVADQETPPELLDYVGYVLRSELMLPVYRHPQGVDLSQVKGRAGADDGNQIRIDQAWAAVAAQIPTNPLEPRQYLVITVRDLYAEGLNYLYGGTTIPGCGIVSYHRIGNRHDPGNDPELRGELCKQSLSTLIKSLTVYPCPDPRDVTAYVNGPFRLGWRGIRPLPATLSAYRFEAERWMAAQQKAREMK